MKVRAFLCKKKSERKYALNSMQKKSLNVNSDSSLNMVVREGDHEAHPCASPFGQQSCAKRLSCRFVEPCRGFSPLSPEFYAKKKSEREFRLFFKYGGERGVRTLDTLPYTHFPGVLLQPLGHLTIFLLLRPRGATGRYYRQSQGSGQAEFSLLLSAYPQFIH